MVCINRYFLIQNDLMKNHESRNEWVDVLRGLVALLVVVHHTALMYGVVGSWFWHEKSPDNSFSSLLLTAFCTFNQAWFMGLFFLLAGAYVPQALARKGARLYLMDRLVRLGLPLIVFGCVLGPLTIALAFTSKGFAFPDTLMALWRQARFESGPQWFVAALWVMTCMVTPFVPWLQRERPFPSTATMWGAALMVGASAFLIRLVWPVGQTWWMGWQLGYFPSYVLLFIAGVAGAQSRWWFDVPATSARTWRRVMRWAIWLFPLVAIAGSRIPGLAGPAVGGWNVQAFAYAFWEPLVAWGVLLRLLRWAPNRFACPTASFKAIGRSALTVYLIHPPIVVCVGVALHGWPAPALIKFVLSSCLSVLMCLAISFFLNRLPLWRKWF